MNKMTLSELLQCRINLDKYLAYVEGTESKKDIVSKDILILDVGEEKQKL